jgi:hypothetical protein
MKTRHSKVASRQAASSTTSWGLRAALVTAALWSAVLAFWPWEARGADRSRSSAVIYLVTPGSCPDCRTPGYFCGEPDPKLGGSEVGFEIPGRGVFYGPNLAPDKETEIGTWSEADSGATLSTVQPGSC